MSADDLHPSADTAFARGRLLQSQHRLQDAIACYKQALALEANHTPSLVMLALCWMEDDSTAPQSLDAARRAVATAPEDAFARGVLALALNANAKDGQTEAVKKALEAASQAVALDPDSDFAHAVQARLHLRLRAYDKAEASARAALALDLENTMAAEALSAALLMQKKDADNQSLITYQLERDPGDDSAHTSAGWQALMEGDHKRANQHFLEALRLNPMNEGARMGLVESYRARSWFYRAFLGYCHWMNQFTEGRQNAIMIGGFIAYKVVSGMLKDASPFWFHLVVALWLILVFWTHLARSIGTFFVTLDKFARQSLKPAEFWEGAGVGLLVMTALGVLAASLINGQDGVFFSGLAFLSAALAVSSAFSNDHHAGRPLYFAAAGVAVLGACYFGLSLYTGLALPGDFPFGLTALAIGVGMTWLKLFRFLYA